MPSKPVPCGLTLDKLPDELLVMVMTMAMASEVPVQFELCPELPRNDYPVRVIVRNADRPLLSRLKSSFLKSQEEHHSDWRIATGVSHRLRLLGIPAFFSEKIFIVPPTTLRVLREGRVQSEVIDIAVKNIRNVVISLESHIRPRGFIGLPLYHYFKRLQTLTIIIHYYRNDALRRNLVRSWANVPPKKLLDMFARLQLRTDDIKVRLSVLAADESHIPRMIAEMERHVYPVMESLIRQRTASKGPPAEDSA